MKPDTDRRLAGFTRSDGGYWLVVLALSIELVSLSIIFATEFMF